ncbi:MAG: cysteine desulfurase family protein [bacterium]|nr:cysteine desulfurase family protein [bacterium]
MFLKKPKNIRTVYLDNAATTQMDPKVKEAMDPYFCDLYGNPSGIYKMGRIVSAGLDNAREKVAEILSTSPNNIIFTAGGTESDNLAIFGIAEKHAPLLSSGKAHIITTKVEHKAVLQPIKQLEKDGFDVTYLDVDSEGKIDVGDLKKALRKNTILISIMYANNEIGTIQPIAEIGKLILKWRKENNTEYPYFHTDACQAAGALSLKVESLHVDLLTFNGSKIYGPKGVGVLYRRKGVLIKPQILGGGQEFGLRGGTENVAGIVGLAKALELVQASNDKENKRLIELRAYFWKQLEKNIPKLHLNGPSLNNDKTRLPNNLNVTFLDIEGEALLLYLDEYGIVCSTGSACNSISLDPSYVITSCGLPYEYAHGSIRFAMGKNTTKSDIDYVMAYLPNVVEVLRKMSPVNLASE